MIKSINKKNIFPTITSWGFYLFVFLLPWQTRFIWRRELMGGFFEYGSLSLYVTEVILVILLIMTVIWKFKKINGFDNPTLAKPDMFWYMIGFFELAVFISIFWSADKALAIYGWWRVVLGIGLFWLVLQDLIDTRKVLGAFLLSAVIQGLLGAWQFLTQSTFAVKWLGLSFHQVSQGGTFVVENFTGRFLRAYGSFPHPNILGGFLVISLLLLPAYFLLKNKKTLFLFSGYSAAVILSAGLFFSFSRSAWLSLIFFVALIIILAYLKKEILWVKFLTVILLSFIVLSGLFPGLVKTRLGLEAEQRLEKISIQERGDYLNDAKEVLGKHWHSGVGVKNYTLTVNREIDPGGPVWRYQPVHNIYLLIFSELGVAGIFIFLFLILYVIYQSLTTIIQAFNNSCHIQNNQRWQLIIFFFAFCSLLFIGLVDHYLWTLYAGIMLWWLILGLWYRSFKRYSTDR